MECKICKRFPVPTSKFEEIAISIERHGTLYRCKACGIFFEHIAEERSIRYTLETELRVYYPNIFDEEE